MGFPGARIPTLVDGLDFRLWPSIEGIDPTAPAFSATPSYWGLAYGAQAGRPCWVSDSGTSSAGAVVLATATGPYLPTASPRTGLVGALTVEVGALMVSSAHAGVGPYVRFGDSGACLFARHATGLVEFGWYADGSAEVVASIARPATGVWHTWRWDVTAGGGLSVRVDGAVVGTGTGVDLGAINAPRWAVGCEGVATPSTAARGWAFSGLRVAWG